MIKDKTQFPLLEVVQFCENGKAVINMCNDGIQSMEEALSELYKELVFAKNKQQVMDEIHACERHLIECFNSKYAVTVGLKTVNVIFN